MAIIDCAIFKDTGDEFVLAYKYPETNLSTYTQLIVYESQEALLFSKGKLIGKFGPGKHTLDTENLPLLRTLFKIPFGGKNPFTAEVWIINKLFPANLPWGVKNISVHDADYQTMIPLKAIGQYGIHISDAEKFMIKMVGTKDKFTENDLLSQAYGEFSTLSKSFIVEFMNTQAVGIKSISANLNRLSTFLKGHLQPFWEEYGLELTKFYITEVSIDKSEDVGKRVADAIASQASMTITGHSWQQEQMFGVANKAVENIGNGGNGLLASMMAINMMGGGGFGANIGNGMMQPHNSQPNFSNNNNSTPNYSQTDAQAPRMIYCANCSKKHLTTEKFCPHCGSQYNPCPSCGSDNMPNAKRCISCGKTLGDISSSKCPVCGKICSAGTAFCPNCGAAMKNPNNSLTCERCGTMLSPNDKFCPNCGMKKA